MHFQPRLLFNKFSKKNQFFKKFQTVSKKPHRLQLDFMDCHPAHNEQKTEIWRFSNWGWWEVKWKCLLILWILENVSFFMKKRVEGRFILISVFVVEDSRTDCRGTSHVPNWETRKIIQLKQLQGNNHRL